MLYNGIPWYGGVTVTGERGGKGWYNREMHSQVNNIQRNVWHRNTKNMTNVMYDH